LVRKRDLREEERELWEHVTRDVRKARARRVRGPVKAKAVSKAEPVAPARSAPVRKSAPDAPPPSHVKREAPFGLDGATEERLRRGKIAPEATLDLHGLTQAQAHARLVQFVRQGHEVGNRCLLVITGKGAPACEERISGFVMPERSKAGVLRMMVPRWLEELRAVVTGVQSAHQRHGGAGAFYVYLRRRRG
jgi:DNA-nicking Smr family endonuclease